MTDAQKRTGPRRFRSLGSRLIRSIATAGAVCTLAVAALQIALMYRDHRQDFEAEIRSIARLNVPLLSVNLWDIEPDAIRRQLQLIAERPQIAYVRLEAVTGQQFESGSPTRREDPRTVILDIPYPEGKPGRLGTLQLAPNVEHLYAVLLGDVLRLLAASALRRADDRVRSSDRADLHCYLGDPAPAVAIANAAHRRFCCVTHAE